MFGRQVGSLLRRPLSTRLPFRTSSLQSPRTIGPRALYHATGRLSKEAASNPNTGEPSRTVKKNVKRDSTKKTPKDAATKKVTKAKKKAATKKKTPPKKKPAVKRPLTEAQKIAKKDKSEKAGIAELKKVALAPPQMIRRHITAANVFIAEKSRGSGGLVAVSQKGIFDEFKQLSPAQLEHYNHLANELTKEKRAALKSFITSHTPEQIKQANAARAKLRRKVKSTSSKRRYAPLEDERRVKPPMSGYVLFCVNRHASGDFKGIGLGERSKLISAEWKAMNSEEKQKYLKLEEDESKRYVDEHTRVYGYPPAVVAETSSKAKAEAKE